MKKKILYGVLISMTMISSLLAWWAVHRAIMIPQASNWIVPIIAFSSFAILLSLGMMLMESTVMIAGTLMISLLLGLIFQHNLLHLTGIFFSFGIFMFCARGVQNELKQNVRIHPWKALYLNKTSFVFVIALVIASQYFFTIQTVDGVKALPQINVGPIVDRVFGPVMGYLYPQVKDIDSNMTIDEFILKSEQDRAHKEEKSIDAAVDEYFAMLPESNKKEIVELKKKEIEAAKNNFSEKEREIILKSGRSQISQATGVAINGDEKMVNIYSEIINTRLSEYFMPSDASPANTPYPLVLSVVLLISLYAVGSLLSTLWFLIAVGIFKLLVKFNIVIIGTVAVEKQVIT